MLKSKCDGDISADNLRFTNIDRAKLPPNRVCLNMLKEHPAQANYQTKYEKWPLLLYMSDPKPGKGIAGKRIGNLSVVQMK
jgi:hypothetical protein